MEMSSLFGQAWRLTWNHKILWLLGFVTGLTGTAPNLFIRIPGRRILDSATRIDLLDRLASSSEQPLWILPLIGGTIALLVIGILLWLLAVIAEAGVIQSVAWQSDGQSISFGRTWKAGTRYLGRLISIDTIIFFPVFVILLLGLLLASGSLFGAIIYGSTAGNNLSDVFKFIGVAGGGILALLCLVIPVALATFLLRLLAFRSAIIEGKSARDSIRRAWEIARNFPANILALAIMLMVIRYLISLPGSLIDMSAMTVSLGGVFTTNLEMSWLASLESLLFNFGFLVQLLTLFIGAVLNVFILVAWTLAYRDWAENLTQEQMEELSNGIPSESS